MVKKVKILDLTQSVTNLLVASGLDNNEAKVVIDHLLDAEFAGHSSHGFIRIPKIVKDLKAHNLSKVKIERDNPVSAMINGGFKTGLVNASTATDLVLSKASSLGIGIVGGYNNTGTIGALGYYTRNLANNNYIGIMMCSSEYAMAPWGGKDAILGTNPISFSFPTKTQPIVIDFSSSVWSYGNLKLAMEEGRTIPTGIVIDKDGNDSTDPNDADNGSQLPIAGHKGYGLGLAIEILAGLYVSAKAGFQAVEGTDGFLVMALKPDLFVSEEEYKNHLDALLSEIKSCALRPGFDEILIPGEKSARKRSENLNKEYLELPEFVLSNIDNL